MYRHWLVNLMDKKSYFDGNKSILCSSRINTSVIFSKADTLAQALALASGKEFKLIVYLYNEVKLGYFKDNKILFVDAEELDEKYFLQARLFNKNEEIWIQKTEDTFAVRQVTDGETGALCTVVDSSSEIFGKALDDIAAEGFVHLVEPGRKISMIIPAEKGAVRYELTTRSYITYDDCTGQAGFGYYRWVDIAEGE